MLEQKPLIIKIAVMLKTIVLKLVNAEVLRITYVIKNIVCLKNYVVFHNRCNYDYRFIIKELVKGF